MVAATAELHSAFAAMVFVAKFPGTSFARMNGRKIMPVGTIILILLIILLIGALPTWPYSGGWGYYPSGGLGLVVIILLILILMGRL